MGEKYSQLKSSLRNLNLHTVSHQCCGWNYETESHLFHHVLNLVYIFGDCMNFHTSKSQGFEGSSARRRCFESLGPMRATGQEVRDNHYVLCFDDDDDDDDGRFFACEVQ